MLRRAVFVLIAMLIAGALPLGGALAQDKPQASLTKLLGELRQGGFVIYLRHAATVPAGSANEAENLANCADQRNLSSKGRADALQIGKSIKTLGIPIGAVVSSPYCRAKDTARLAFGHYTEEPELSFVISYDADETRRLAASLRRLLAAVPEPGSNSAIVSHSANLYEAAGIFAKPEGAAYIFRPKADGGFEAVARLLPEDWSEAARSLSAGSGR
jgi:phosphohistidine phosphatase SixA